MASDRYQSQSQPTSTAYPSIYSQASSYQSPTPTSPATIDSTPDPYNLPPPPAYPGPQSQQPPPQPRYPAPQAPPSKPSNNSTSPPPQPSSTPSGAQAMPQSPEGPPVDTPVITDTEQGRRLDLVVELGKPYTPDDILVKLEGRQLLVEAEHVEKTGGKKSKSCMSREFDLEADIDPRTVQANFDDNGRLIIAATVLPKSEGEGQSEVQGQEAPSES